MIKQRFALQFSSMPIWGYFTLALLLICLIIDFNHRIKVSLNRSDSTQVAAQFALSFPNDPNPLWSPTMLQWYSAFEQATTNDQSAPDSEVESPLMSGASVLGKLQVRVRGIFRLPGSKQAGLALIESYEAQSREYRITRYKEGDNLGGYTISALKQDAVVFSPTKTDPQENVFPVVVRVFNKANTE